MSGDADLRPRQLRAIEALAAGATVADAAAAAGIGERQLRRWRDDPAFAQAVRDATGDLFADALRVLAGGMRDAAQYLVDAAAGRADAEPARTNVARSVLQIAPAVHEHAELLTRLDALEAAQADDNRSR